MRDKQFYDREYTKGNKSLRQIAREQQVSPSTVLSELKKLGVHVKTKSEVQKERLTRIKHPTKGRNRTEEEKTLIGKGVADQWQSLTDSELKERTKVATKALQDANTGINKKIIQKKAAKALLKAAESGSKIEKFFLKKLAENGFKVEWHKNLSLREKLQVDLYLPLEKIAIEVDGVSHFKPIHGDEKLAKQQESDRVKNALLMSFGITVIRFRLAHSNYSLTKLNNAFDKLMKTLGNLPSGVALVETDDESV